MKSTSSPRSDGRHLLCQKKSPSTSRVFHFSVLKSDLFYVKQSDGREEGGLQGEIMSFVFDANQLHSGVFLDQVMVP